MKPKHIFGSPGKTNFNNPRCFLYRFEHANIVLMLMVNTVPCRTFSGISF